MFTVLMLTHVGQQRARETELIYFIRYTRVILIESHILYSQAPDEHVACLITSYLKGAP